MQDDSELLDWIENELFGTPTGVDVAQHMPSLTSAEAYRLRRRLVQRRVAKGDRLIGYKVGGSSKAIREEEKVQEQLVGALMRSGLVPDGGLVSFGAAKKIAVEAEVAVMVGRELRGPGLTLLEVLPAVEGCFAAIEIIPGSGAKRSEQARILGAKFTGGIVLGPVLSSHRGKDLRLEGAVLSVNGIPQGSATGVAVMGNPLHAVALVANHLAAFGEALQPGMVIMTGSYMGNVHVAPGDAVDVAFSTLGRVGACFAA